MSMSVVGQVDVISDPEELTMRAAQAKLNAKKIVLIPTMGALHDGHLSLISRASQIPNTFIIVSIFINPLQFGVGEDFNKYPRTLATDLAALSHYPVDIVFTPDAEHMYPAGMRTTVSPGPLANELEGETRPGHFAGMLTVVAKLLFISSAQVLVMGEKDYQQLVLVRQMVQDLNLNVKVIGSETIREDSGLALSSRNRYLSDLERSHALVLYNSLLAGAHKAKEGLHAVYQAAEQYFTDHSAGVKLEYLQLRDNQLNAADAHSPGRLLIAARVGSVRLIDNIEVIFP